MDVKLGICNFCVPGKGMFAPKFVAEAGLDGMSIEYGTLKERFPLSLREVQNEYLDAQQKYGIEYCNIGLSGFNDVPFHVRENDPLREEIMGFLTGAVDTAKRMGIPLVFVPCFLTSYINDDEDLKYVIKNLKFVCDYAGERDIDIAFEGTLDVKRTLQVYKEVDKPNFNLFYDSQNYYYVEGYDQVEILKGTYDYIYPQLHVKDGTKDIWSGKLLGTGESNFNGAMNFLKEKDYTGWIILENLYELNPDASEKGVFELFKEDVRILKEAVK